MDKLDADALPLQTPTSTPERQQTDIELFDICLIIFHMKENGGSE
jgi:hypothetical protein